MASVSGIKVGENQAVTGPGKRLGDAKEVKSGSAGGDPAAKVEISPQGQDLAKAMQASGEGAGVEAARDKQMNDLIDFYANKLIRAAKKLDEKGPSEDGSLNSDNMITVAPKKNQASAGV